MALLDGSIFEGVDRRRLTVVAVLAVTAAIIASCSMMNWGGGDELAFSHEIHVTDQDMDCSVCHKRDTGSELPSMPEPGLCLLCHKELDAEKPQDRRIHVLFENDVYKATHASMLVDEVLFDHSSHTARDADCASCHTDIRIDQRITEADAITMEQCIACHAKYEPQQSCTVCHSEIDELWQPESHLHEWKKAHGQVMRLGTSLQAQRCDLCHAESTCIQCHQSEKPENHDNFWRLQGHGIVAGIDRQNCWTCHRDDYCSRCHSEVLPLSHTGTFGSPRNTHCFGCHFPLRGEGCVTCHQATPSHDAATPLPPDHNPAMNCRLCHGAGVPLMHVDDGSDCTLCHR